MIPLIFQIPAGRKSFLYGGGHIMDHQRNLSDEEKLSNPRHSFGADAVARSGHSPVMGFAMKGADTR